MFNVRKTKRIAKFDSLEPRRCKDMKGIVAPEIGPKRFGTFEKQAPGQHRQIFMLAANHKKSDMRKGIFPTDPGAHPLAVVTVIL